MDILILIGSFAVVCLLGMPVAYALGLAAILAALWIDIPLEAVMLKVSGGMSGFSLLAIPFFILCGAIMAVGGMAERLVNLAKVFVGFIRGGMALVNIVASTMFGCISGSSVADTAAVGAVMIPQMIKNGYPRLFAVNVTISGSLQPLLLPPSHNMIIYSLAAGGTISVAQLFMGGVIPALLLGLSLIVLVLIIAHREKFPKGEVVPLRQALKIALDALWGLITIVIILGGILTGVFTPTESAAVACVYAFCVTMFVYRDCKWRDLPKLIARVVRTVGMVMIMIGFSNPLYQVGADAMLADMIPSDKRTDAYAINRIANNAAFALGPAVGGFLATRSYNLAFYGAALGFLTYSLLLLFKAKDTLHLARAETKHISTNDDGYTRVFQDKRFIGITALISI
jgi:tripartite ATP-independent transporter DctM subunit